MDEELGNEATFSETNPLPEGRRQSREHHSAAPRSLATMMGW